MRIIAHPQVALATLTWQDKKPGDPAAKSQFEARPRMALLAELALGIQATGQLQPASKQV